MTLKLHQHIATHKNIHTRTENRLTEIHKTAQRGDLFTGFIRTYQSREEGGDQFDTERKLVQQTVQQVVRGFTEAVTEVVDAEATKNNANRYACADLVVGGQVVAAKVPVTTLIFLENKVTDFRTFVRGLPTLDPAISWQPGRDSNTGFYVSEPVRSHKTKKVPKSMVLLEPTKEHPGKAELITEDVVIGYWTATQFSGAIPQAVKAQLEANCNAMLDAIKAAREEANQVDVERSAIAGALFDFITKPINQ